MMHEKRINGILALVLASIIALSSIACLTSAFELEPDDWTHIICMTVLFSTVSVLCLSFRFGELILTALAILALYLVIRHGDLLLSLEKLLNHITTYYDNAYGWGVMRWSWEPLHRENPDTALMVLAALPAMATCWVIQKRQWFGCAVLAALPPLALCCVVTDTQPDNTWLWLLLTALLLVAMTQRLRRISHRDANRLTALLLVPAMLFTGMIFGFTSENTCLSQAQHLQQSLLDGFSNLTGLDFMGLGSGSDGPVIPGVPGSSATISSSLDLAELNTGDPSDETVMTVRTTAFSGVLYLRGQSFDRYTGTTWDATAFSGDHGWPNGDFTSQGRVTITTERQNPLLYFPYYINIPRWEAYLTNGYYPNFQNQTEYSFRMQLPGVDTVADPLTDDQRRQYLELPEDTMEAAQDILKEADIRTGLPADFVASVIADYVRDAASYDLDTGKMPAGATDFAIWFLEDSETGYCVHFATAAAVLMRAANIPARYVTGFMTRVVAGEDCAVPSSQAHAWVEYYHPNKGWTVLEATPVEPEDPIIVTPPTQPTDPTETTEPTETTQPTETTEPTETTQPTETVDPTETTGVTQPTDVTRPDPTETTAPIQGQPDPTEPDSQEPAPTQLNLKWIRWILLALGIWLLIAGQYRLRIRLRKRKLHRGAPNQQAIRRWRYVRRLSRISGFPASGILPLAEKAAFSQHQLTEEELGRFDEWFRQANQALLKKPWILQFFLRLIFAVE